MNGYRPDPVDTVALEKFRTPPRTVGELRSLLGFLGYYRAFVKDFAIKMKPLYDLLKLEKPKPKVDKNTCFIKTNIRLTEHSLKITKSLRLN